MDINRKSNLTCFTNLDLKRVQCVSRIWTSFAWSHLLMVVRFQAQADFHYYPSCITIDAHFKSGQSNPKIIISLYYSKSVIHSVCKKNWTSRSQQSHHFFFAISSVSISCSHFFVSPSPITYSFSSCLHILFSFFPFLLRKEEPNPTNCHRAFYSCIVARFAARHAGETKIFQTNFGCGPLLTTTTNGLIKMNIISG